MVQLKVTASTLFDGTEVVLSMEPSFLRNGSQEFRILLLHHTVSV